jgi:hypothetical protein
LTAHGEHPIVRATLAAAQSENGDFPAAIATESARQTAAAAKDPVRPQRLEDWKARFSRKEAVRE